MCLYDESLCLNVLNINKLQAYCREIVTCFTKHLRGFVYFSLKMFFSVCLGITVYYLLRDITVYLHAT